MDKRLFLAILALALAMVANGCMVKFKRRRIVLTLLGIDDISYP